ncbi:MAG TPA: hypothetical protein VGF38_21120 [Ktedonobacterales bacterium]|jgi:predicted GH43/DUF377 family glycosyl hydrolase
MPQLTLQRLGVVMEPEPGNPQEIEGVLNPAAIRGRDGHLYLFPRLVGPGNYSRIGIARVRFDSDGNPAGVERLGIALEPEADYERRPEGGGCEDPRITYVEPLQRYLMTYTAHSPLGPRIALASSEDLFHWERLGLATFESYHGIDFMQVDNKDATVFPVAIPNHAGKLQLGLLHRPLFPGTRPGEWTHQRAELSDLTPAQHMMHGVGRPHESIWISYCPIPSASVTPQQLGMFNSHHRLAAPAAAWERFKIGGGTPPMLTRHGWLLFYHGVERLAQAHSDGRQLRYSAGVMILAKDHPHHLRYRSPEPVLFPILPQERQGMIANVVFPTGIDRRDDLGAPERFDIYYGMADSRIGVARLDLPAVLPVQRVADPTQAARALRRPLDAGRQPILGQRQ